MATAENALLQFEGGQTSYAMTALTDSGDHQMLTSEAEYFSRVTGYAPVVRPNGLLTGGAISAAGNGGNDDIDVAALSCNLNGAVTSVAADADVSVTRPATAVSKVNSITVNSSGAIAVVAGVDGDDTSFSEVRGANGGPPLIPVDSIEIGQVRLTSDTSAPIESTELFVVFGVHVERASYPGYTLDYFAGKVNMDAALPLIHVGPAAKPVYASYAEPIFAEIQLATDYVPPANTHSVNSRQVYRKTTGSTSSTLGQGAFTALLEDGITDGLIALQDEITMFKFYPDYTKSPYRVDQGKLGVALSYPADNDIEAACTVSAESLGVEYAS